MSAESSHEETSKKQLNLGLVDEYVVHRIQARTDEIASKLRNDGFGKLNKRDFMVDFIDILLPAVDNYLFTDLSRKDSTKLATREVVEKRLRKNINKIVREFMIGIAEVLESHKERILDDMYGPKPKSTA